MRKIIDTHDLFDPDKMEFFNPHDNTLFVWFKLKEFSYVKLIFNDNDFTSFNKMMIFDSFEEGCGFGKNAKIKICPNAPIELLYITNLFDRKDNELVRAIYCADYLKAGDYLKQIEEINQVYSTQPLRQGEQFGSIVNEMNIDMIKLEDFSFLIFGHLWSLPTFRNKYMLCVADWLKVLEFFDSGYEDKITFEKMREIFTKTYGRLHYFSNQQGHVDCVIEPVKLAFEWSIEYLGRRNGFESNN